jgi:hypothetical protein
VEVDVLRIRVGAFAIAGFAALVAASTQVRAEDDFPITGTYTENKACEGADASVPRVKITAKDIDSSVFGLCTILKKAREGDKFSVHVECKGPGGTVMLGDVIFTIKADKTLDFHDQDNTYKAVLYKCP